MKTEVTDIIVNIGEKYCSVVHVYCKSAGADSDEIYESSLLSREFQYQGSALPADRHDAVQYANLLSEVSGANYVINWCDIDWRATQAR